MTGLSHQLDEKCYHGIRDAFISRVGYQPLCCALQEVVIAPSQQTHQTQRARACRTDHQRLACKRRDKASHSYGTRSSGPGGSADHTSPHTF